MGKKVATIPNFEYRDTSDPNIKQFVDQHGDWTHYWLVKEKRFVKAVNHVLSLGYNKGPGFRLYLESHTKEEIAKTLSERGDEGARTHAAIRDLLKGLRVTMTTKYPSDLVEGRQDVLNSEEWWNIECWLAWCARYQPRTIAFEEAVTNGVVAGTLDYLGVITVPSGDKTFEKPYWGKDVLLLPDWKTSSSIWTEYEAQTAIYLEMARKNKKFEKFFKAFGDRVFTGIVRLGTKHVSGYHFEPWGLAKSLGEHLDRFNAAIVIANRHETKFEPKIEEIPTQYFIRLPKAKLPKVPRKAKAKQTKQLPL